MSGTMPEPGTILRATESSEGAGATFIVLPDFIADERPDRRNASREDGWFLAHDFHNSYNEFMWLNANDIPYFLVSLPSSGSGRGTGK